MKKLGKISPAALKLLTERGIDEKEILLIAKSDMSFDGTLCDCYLVLTGDGGKADAKANDGHTSNDKTENPGENSGKNAENIKNSGGKTDSVKVSGDKAENTEGTADGKATNVNGAIAVLAISEGLKRREDADIFSLRRIEPAVFEYGWSFYPLSELTDFKITEYISSGRLSVGIKGSDDRASLAYFTNAHKKDIRTFMDCASKVAEGKPFPAELCDKAKDNTCPKCHMEYPDPEKKVCPHCMDKGKLLKKLLPFFAKYKLQIALVFLTIFLSTALSLLSPYIGEKFFYDEVLDPAGSRYGRIGGVLIIIIAANFLSYVFSAINGIINARVTAWVSYDMKKTIFSAFGRLSLSFFTGRQTGGLMTQVNSDAGTLYWFFCDGFPYFCTNVIKIIAISILLFSISAKLTLLVLVPLPIFFVIYKFVINVFQKLYARNYSKSRAFTSIVSDVLSGMRIVKAFSREKTEITRFNRKSNEFSDSSLHILRMENTFFPAIFLFVSIASYLIWIFGGWLVIQHGASGGIDGISYGTLMLFISYMSMIVEPLRFLSEVSGWWARCFNAMQRLFEILEARPEVEEHETAVSPEKIDGKIEFKNVGFSYTKGKKTIDNVSFTVEPGKTLGIVGHTGAGKSTLANLLTRLYDVSEGEITIDGINIKDLSFKALHEAIAIVSQETYLFRGTILENIRYAKPDATYSEVIAASKAAGAHSFIVKYPDGYNTRVGQDAKQLSGGERQRVSIARAILKQPKILVLDEATAAMDTQTERMIQAALSEITKGKTTVIIAHRLSTLRDADSLIVIENGKMTESGTHSELIVKKGAYFKLYRLQMEALKTIGITE